MSKEKISKWPFQNLELLKIILVEVEAEEGIDKEMIMEEDSEEEIETEKDLETITSEVQEMELVEVEGEEEIVLKVASIVDKMVTFQENVLNVIDVLFSQKREKWWRIQWRWRRRKRF